MNAARVLRLALLLALFLPMFASAQLAAEGRWSSYRDFWFDFDSSIIDPADRDNIRDAANYLRQNPSYRLAIDAGPAESTALGTQRVAAVRAALLAAGVPGYKIQEGHFGDEQLRRERRVELLIESRD